jgi:putative membrane protein
MKRILSPKELDELADVIAQVETETSGELRLMIVGRSTPVSHVFPLAAFALISFSFMVLWILRFELLVSGIGFLPPALMLASIAIAFGLSRWSLVQRLLTSKRDMTIEVWERAQLEFHHEGLNGTKAQTGVLIMLSMMERQAVVLADKGIASKLEGEIWKDVVRIVLHGAEGGRWRSKLEEALRLCGKILKENFPAQAGDTDELPNHVIVKP